MLKAVSLASGSSGNCIFVSTQKTHLLLDLGISLRRLKEELTHFFLTPDDITAVLVTHEHSDHSSSVLSFAKKYSRPVLATRGTIRALTGLTHPGKSFCLMQPGKEYKLNEITVKALKISHDAKEPAGFVIGKEDVKICYFVDLARITREIRSEILDAQLVILDCNYDEKALLEGSYHGALKKRVIQTGHLSNQQVRDFLRSDMKKKLHEFWFAHISENNNSPELISGAMASIFNNNGKEKNLFRILPRKKRGPVWQSRKNTQLDLFLKETIPV
ncbi:MAG TPA: MBL fold metallo-hydrolase [bacterium]|nr:MBL fold metallo-hydrolase [bacterium]